MIRYADPWIFHLCIRLVGLALALALLGCVPAPEARQDTRVHTATCRTRQALLRNRAIEPIHSFARPHRVCGQPDREES